MKISAIVPAAGSGQRMGGSVRKQYLEINGEPIFIHTLRRLAAWPEIEEIILVAPPEDAQKAGEMARAIRVDQPIRIVKGGATRQESVYLGFGHVNPAAELALIHDGVRPFLPLELAERVAAAARKTGAATAACPATDTLKRIKNGLLEESISREGVVLIQTPQCFRYSILAEALERAEKEGISATDESSLAQRIGMDVAMVPAPYWNIKITTQEDLVLASALANYLAR